MQQVILRGILHRTPPQGKTGQPATVPLGPFAANETPESNAILTSFCILVSIQGQDLRPISSLVSHNFAKQVDPVQPRRPPCPAASRQPQPFTTHRATPFSYCHYCLSTSTAVDFPRYTPTRRPVRCRRQTPPAVSM